ncbi:MAG: DegT/DnrJ/EryC1/StrS aminotransferase family protein [Planctomycetota bacterium]
MRETFLPFSPPLIGQGEIDEVVDTLRSGWITTGPKTKRFEQEFAEAVQAEDALALNSCTAGMHLALLAHGVGPGDEVITTAWTFSSTVNVIEHVGARPVVVDVEVDTLNIDPRRVAAAINNRTKAIIPVHFAGHPVDLSTINALAARHDLHVIEDAAHAIGSETEGQPIGGGDNLCSFSFYATKNLTTGEGGMLSGPAELLDRARILSQHGMSREAWTRYRNGGSARYDVIAPGFKYNLSDIQSSLGLSQLRRLGDMQQRRREVVDAYNRAFGGIDVLETPAARHGITHAWHLYVVRLAEGGLTIDRDTFLLELAKRNIGGSVHFVPIPLLSYYRDRYGWTLDKLPVIKRNHERTISLPLSPTLSDRDVADVIDAVLDTVSTHRRTGVAA